MKKNICITICCIALLAISTVAYSARGPYVSANLGVSLPVDSDWTDSNFPGIKLSIESDTGVALGIAGGYDFGNNFRVEGEFVYLKNDLNKVKGYGYGADLSGDMTSYAFLCNAYYDFKNTTAFTPFVSAGVGIAKVELNDFNVPGLGLASYSDDDTVFAYQVGAGIGIALTQTINLDLKYRYFGTSDPEFDTSTITYASHNLYAGVRLSF